MPKRDETLPRVSEIIKFLYEGDFDNIPPETLKAAIERGNHGHWLIEHNWNTDLDHPIVNMFRQGLSKIFTDNQRGCYEAVIEHQLNGYTFTGKPDFRMQGVIIDYKFTRDSLRPATALQLLLYSYLVQEQIGICPNDFYAFHYHQDGGLFIYKIPDRAKAPLRKFALSLVKHHEDIKAGKLIKYDKLIEWDRLQLEYDVFEIFYCTMPPMTITSELEAKTAIMMFRDLAKVEAYTDHLKREIMRYMDENDKTKLWDPTGGGVRLQVSNRKQYDAAKLKVFKETIVTGTKESKSLVRFNPPTKQKQLN
jgi:hypothetical protein